MESIRFILIVAVLVGISVVVQLDVWTGKLGQSQKLGPLLVAVVARELGPLFANFVLIVRGGSAIATELGLMRVGGEVRVRRCDISTTLTEQDVPVERGQIDQRAVQGDAAYALRRDFCRVVVISP